MQQITRRFRSLPIRAVPRPAATFGAQLPSHRLFAPGLSDMEWAHSAPRKTGKAAQTRRRTSVLMFLEKVLCLN